MTVRLVGPNGVTVLVSEEKAEALGWPKKDAPAPRKATTTSRRRTAKESDSDAGSDDNA